jgi:lipopolysaccharide/colanic/teichoic acid biosynthesis glycosyltransferase
MTPIGYFDDGNPAMVATALPLVGSLKNLLPGIDDYKPNWIVVANRQQVGPEWVDAFLRLRFGGIDAADVAGFYETNLARLCLAEMRPSDVFFSESLRPNQFSLNLQSMYSMLLALLLAPLVFPLIGILALLVKASSPGPAFVSEQRVGLNGAPFTVHRLRLSNVRMGRFIKLLGWDGLPLLWNILRGEMSFIGPEPDRPEFAARLNQIMLYNSHRTVVKPGVTGWAQIHDMGDDPLHDALRRLEYDLYYIKNLSTSIDIFVLLRALRGALSFNF